MSTPRLALSGVFPVLFSLACASILDIAEAKHDPALDNGGKSDAGGKSLCQNYCDTVTAACNANDQQYASNDVCLKFCGKLDPGQPDDTSGDTVYCRLNKAKDVKGTGETGSCPIAGPGGDGTCGSNCDALCTVALKTCATQASAFISVDACEAECVKLQDIGHYNVKRQDEFDVQCRLYHVSAAQLDPAFHCPHVRGIGKCNAQSPPPLPTSSP